MAEAEILRDMTGSTDVGSFLRARLSMQLDARSPSDSGKKRGMRHYSALFAASSFDEDMGRKMRPTLVVSFLYFREPLDLAQTTTVLRERLCAIPRFRSVAVTSKEDDKLTLEFLQLSDMELDLVFPRLVKEAPSVKTRKDLDRFVSDLWQNSMDTSLPLWRIYLMNNMEDGRSMMLFVVDHCIADGTALIQVLMSVLDDPPMLPVPAKREPSVRNLVGRGGCLAGCVLQLKGLIRACWGPFVGDKLPGDPPNCLKCRDPRKPGNTRACRMTKDLTMEQIKAVRQKIPGVTINDILMAVTTLTLQEYFRRHEPKTLKQKLRGSFPINMRRVTGNDITSEDNFGNRISFGQLSLPIHISDPLKILAQVKSQIDVIKVSPEPYLRDKMMTWLVLKSGMKFADMADLVLDACGKVTCMLSNVPGPVEEVQFLGQPLDDLSFYALANTGLYFGIVYYNGNFKVGVCCDGDCEPDPDKLADCWLPAFARLQEAASALK